MLEAILFSSKIIASLIKYMSKWGKLSTNNISWQHVNTYTYIWQGYTPGENDPFHELNLVKSTIGPSDSSSRTWSQFLGLEEIEGISIPPECDASP